MRNRPNRVPLYVIISLLVSLCGAALGFAEEAGQEQTLQGEIIDPAAYLKDGSHGAEHVDQTYEAVDGGQTLALLQEGTETLYVLLAEQPGEDPNELVYDYVNQGVKITGKVYERGGLRGIVATTVEPLKPADSATSSPSAP